MRKEAEEIMKKHVDPHCFCRNNCYEAVIDAMVEFVEQQFNIANMKTKIKDIENIKDEIL